MSDPRDIWRQGQAESLRREQRLGRARQSGPKRRPPRGGRAWFAVAGYGGLALVCLCLAAVAFLLVAPPLDAVRDRLIERVSARTGLTLAMSGPASLSLFPRPVVAFSDVALSARDGTEGAAIATVPSIEIEVSLWSLLSRQPQVGRLTLHRPTIDLAIDAAGRRNWEVARAKRKPASAAAVDARGPPASPAPAAGPVTKGASLAGGSVRVVDASLRYRDERSGTYYEISSLNLVLAANDGEGRAEISGRLMWRGVEVGVFGTAAPLRAVLADQPVQLSLKLSAAPVEAAYDGTLALDGGIAAEGKLSIRAASARALGDWLGTALWAGSSTDGLTVSGSVAVADGQLTLSPIEASLGDAALAGSLAVDIKGRPKVSGTLRISELDFSKLLVRRKKRADVPAAPPLSSPAPPPAPDGRAGRKGWSDRVIDPQLLALADADLALSVGHLVYKDVKTDQGRLSVALNGGVAKVTIEDVELYGGRARGKVTLDGTGSVLTVGTDLQLVGVSIRPLLSDAAGVAWLDGRGTLSLALNGQGLSEREIVEALNGKVEVAVREGAITGVDVGKIVGNIQRGRLASLAPAPEDRTAFSKLTGTFDIASGIAKSRDLKLDSTHLQLKGEGAIELGPRRIDYALHAKIVGGPPAAAIRIGTLEIPIGIKGPLDRPTFTVMGQEALTDAVRQIGRNLRSREVQDAIKGLLSGDRDKRVDPRELIEKLLKKE